MSSKIRSTLGLLILAKRISRTTIQPSHLKMTKLVDVVKSYILFGIKAGERRPARILLILMSDVDFSPLKTATEDYYFPL